MANQYANHKYKELIELGDPESLQELSDYLAENQLTPGEINNQYEIRIMGGNPVIYDKLHDTSVIIGNEQNLRRLIRTIDHRITNQCDGLDFDTFQGRKTSRERDN